LPEGGESWFDDGALRECSTIMAKPNNDAGPNTDGTSVLAGASSARGNGAGAADLGAHGDDASSSGNWAEALAGNTVAAQLDALAKAEGVEKPVTRAEKSSAAQKSATPKRHAEDESDDDDDDESEEQSAATKPVLPDDDDDSESDDDDTDAGDEDGGEDLKEIAKKAKALEKDNFKAREKARQMAATLAEKEARVQELERQIKEGGAVISDMPPGFEKVKSLADLDTMEAELTRNLEWAEDHEDGYAGKNAAGKDVEYTPQQVREYRRGLVKQQKAAEKARTALTKRTERRTAASEQAKVKYPFVLDASSPRQALIRELEADHPEISGSPERDLLLGRLVMAKLIESGAYEIVRKTKPKADAATAAKVAPPSPPPVRRTPQKAAADDGDNWALSLARSSIPGAA